VLISWKPYLDAGAVKNASPLDEYRELVAEFQSGAETLSTRGVEDKLWRSDDFQRRLALVTTPDEFRVTHGEVVSTLRSYFEDFGDFIDARETAIKEVVSVIGDGVASIASESQQHHNRLTDFTKVLQRVGHSRDLPEMRRRLNDEVTQIRSYLDRMQEANRAKVQSLEQQLHALQSRLKRTEEPRNRCAHRTTEPPRG
jgi:exonuclease VII large subunit